MMNRDMTTVSIMNRFAKNKIAKKLGISEHIIRNCIMRYVEDHRFYHTLAHIFLLLRSIDDSTCSETFKPYLELIALFHDVIMNPRQTNNEKQSAAFFKNAVVSRLVNIGDADYDTIYHAILDTAYEFPMKDPSSDISKIFIDMDFNAALYRLSTSDIIENSLNVLKEYQCIDYPTLIRERTKFIDRAIEYIPQNEDPMALIIAQQVVESYRPKIAVFAGSFRPFHVGHMDILEKAEKLFDKVIIVSTDNNGKPDVDDIFDNVGYILPFHQIIVNHDLMTLDIVNDISKYADVSMIRGIRNAADLQHEETLNRYMSESGDFNMVYYMFDIKNVHVSSGSLRSIYGMSDRKMYSRYIPTKYSYHASMYNY